MAGRGRAGEGRGPAGTALCILLGAEINAELERQTHHDSTRGPARPRGERQAYAADTVGAAAPER